MSFVMSGGFGWGLSEVWVGFGWGLGRVCGFGWGLSEVWVGFVGLGGV